MKNLMGKNQTLQLYKVIASYDKDIDDWFVERLEATDTFFEIKVPSQEEICKKVGVNRKRHIALVSKNDVFICEKSTNRPVAYMKKATKVDD
jgi:hypothetical protein